MNIFTRQLGGPGVTLTGYLPSQSPELSSANIRPAILIFPGGGYSMCSDREAEPIALAYAAEGYAAFVLRYSVGEGHTCEEALADAQAALACLHENHAEWAIDPERIAVVGFSAGGHLAAMLGVTGPVRPSALVLGYPCILASMGAALGKPMADAAALVNEATPPSFVFSTSNDFVVPIENSLAFCSALAANNVEFEVHIFRKGNHGLSLAKPHTANGQKAMVEPSVSQWFALSVNWLKARWGDFAADKEAPAFVVDRKNPGLDMPLELLIKNDAWCAILEETVPGITGMITKNPIALKASLRILAGYSPDALPQATLSALEEKFKQL